MVALHNDDVINTRPLRIIIIICRVHTCVRVHSIQQCTRSVLSVHVFGVVSYIIDYYCYLIRTAFNSISVMTVTRPHLQHSRAARYPPPPSPIESVLLLWLWLLLLFYPVDFGAKIKYFFSRLAGTAGTAINKRVRFYYYLFYFFRNFLHRYEDTWPDSNFFVRQFCNRNNNNPSLMLVFGNELFFLLTFSPREHGWQYCKITNCGPTLGRRFNGYCWLDNTVYNRYKKNFTTFRRFPLCEMIISIFFSNSTYWIYKESIKQTGVHVSTLPPPITEETIEINYGIFYL